MSTVELTSIENDCLKEMANVGGGHASGALSLLFNRKVNLGVPNVKLVPLNSVKRNDENKIIVVYSNVESEDMVGNLILVLPFDSSITIKETLNKDGSSDTITQDDEKFFRKIGSVVFKSYAEALNNFLSMDIKYSDSYFVLSSSETMMDSIIKDKDLARYALIISTGFTVDGSKIFGEFDISFIPNEIEHLLGKIKEKFGLA